MKTKENIENQQVSKRRKTQNIENQPVVGQGATIHHWSDRSAYEVLSVAKDGKSCIIDRYDPERIDNNGMSECQAYKYEKLHGNPELVVFYRGKWRFKKYEIVFTDQYEKEMEEFDGWSIPQKMKHRYGEQRAKEMIDLIYSDDMMPQNVIDGITRKKTKYHAINISFGVKAEYYDFSF